jgi:hypothetical protein
VTVWGAPPLESTLESTEPWSATAFTERLGPVLRQPVTAGLADVSPGMRMTTRTSGSGGQEGSTAR